MNYARCTRCGASTEFVYEEELMEEGWMLNDSGAMCPDCVWRASVLDELNTEEEED